MFTLPLGHPSHARVSGGAAAGSEVESATTSASVQVPAKKTATKTRVKAAPKPVVVEDKDTVELDLESATEEPKDDVEE